MADVLNIIFKVLLFLNCLLLVAVILVQRGKGGGLAAAFGAGGGGESAFGARTATAIKKATAVLAVIYIVLAAALYKMNSGKQPSTAAQNEPTPVTSPMPDSTPDE